MPTSLTAFARSALLCGALALGAAAAHAQTFRWAAQNDILTLDPHSQNHATTNNIMAHVYEPLVRYDRDNRIQPALATSWSQLSATTWRFNLRKNVTFHDGSPFTADDVIFSFDRSRQPQGTMGIYVAGVTEIRKIDSHTIDVVLNGPNPLLLNNFTYFFIMNKAWAAKNRSEKVQDYKAGEIIHAARNTNGTGPFTLKEWQPDQRLVLNANKSWWDKMPGNVSEVIYTPIKSDATRVAALLAGNVDAVTDVPTQDVARLRANANLSILDGPEVRTIFIGFDMGSDELKHGSKGKNPFKDVRVRRALNMSVDRVAIQRTIMRGLSVPGMLLVAPGVNGYSADADKPVAVDVEAAKKLLAEAGYPNGFEFTLDCPNNRYVNDEEVCQAVVNMWARVGVRVKLNAQNFAGFIAKIQNFDTSAYLLGWGVATYDALYSLQSLARTRAGGADGNFNFLRISNARLDSVVDRAKTENDTLIRDRLLREGLAIVRDEALYVPIHHQIRPWAMKKNVTMVHNSNDAPKMWFVSVK
ncbi:MAG: ABC transporter substrate-binding protein [Burkholderiaceae bacterium]|jgi:peptide/nickel transport system substrate-binding protein